MPGDPKGMVGSLVEAQLKNNNDWLTDDHIRGMLLNIISAGMITQNVLLFSNFIDFCSRVSFLAAGRLYFSLTMSRTYYCLWRLEKNSLNIIVENKKMIATFSPASIF